MSRKIKKHIWLPAALFIYMCVMAWTFRETLTVAHDYLRYFGTIGVELLVLAALVVFLRKREKLKERREEADRINLARRRENKEEPNKEKI